MNKLHKQMMALIKCSRCGATPGIRDITITNIILCRNCLNEYRACRKVRLSPSLSKHSDLIFDHWSNWNEHMEWICKATNAEILGWVGVLIRDRDDE